MHADVFRTPRHHELLSVYVGTGGQLLGMAVITQFFALLGFLSPANRGGLLTAMLLLFVLMGSYGGYITARVAKMFHAQSWRTVTLTGVVLPGMRCDGRREQLCGDYLAWCTQGRVVVCSFKF